MSGYASDERMLKTLRAQAWERAKGELRATLATYWDGPGKDQKFQAMNAAVNALIAKVDGDGLVE